MGNVLANELKKYYRKEGNRLVFKNGLTLNRLAWEMWEGLNFQGIEPGVLSRVMSGKRRFSGAQLEMFCKKLNLSVSETNRLRNSLQKEILANYGMEFSEDKNQEEVVNYLEKNCHQVTVAVANGAPIIAQEIGDLVFDFTELLLKEKPEDKLKRRLLNLRARTMVEYTDALFSTTSEDRLLIRVTPVLNKMNKLGKFLKDEYIYKSSYSLKASMLSLAGKHGGTFAAADKGLENNGLDEFQSVTSIKSAIVSAVRINQKQRLLGYTGLLNNKMSRISDNFKIMANYSLASAQAKLGNLAAADKNLKLAWEGYDKLKNNKVNKFVIPRRLSLAKCEMVLGLENPGFRDKNYLEKLALDSREIAQMAGYSRVGKNFEGYLERLL